MTVAASCVRRAANTNGLLCEGCGAGKLLLKLGSHRVFAAKADDRGCEEDDMGFFIFF